MMLILDSPYTDPRYNIAAEEYLLKETNGDYAFFYINEPSAMQRSTLNLSIKTILGLSAGSLEGEPYGTTLAT